MGFNDNGNFATTIVREKMRNMYATAIVMSEITISQHLIKSSYLKRSVEIEIFLPDGLLGNEKLNLLLLNDGQDAAALHLQDTLSQLYNSGKTGAIAVVAIKAAEDRIQEYGVISQPDYLGRGAKAKAYNNFIIKELMPFLNQSIAFPINGTKAFAGFSLGGLSAFDICWNNSHIFDVAGVLSGSFWWRSKDLKDGYTDADRIMHRVVSATKGKPDLKFWLMTGTEDEAADRNRNFIIDSIDDTVDLIKTLVTKGYHRPNDIYYYEMVGGEHNVTTWAKALPAFLTWAFPPVVTSY